MNCKEKQLENEIVIATEAAAQVLRTIATVIEETQAKQRLSVASRYAGRAILQCNSLQKHLQKAVSTYREICEEHDHEQ